MFLRKRRHELLNEAFQQELAGLHGAGKRGHPPASPALLVLAMILQAYTGTSDEEMIEATTMDRRWLHQRQLTPAGRVKLRERVTVEHTLAHLGHWQGRRARYRGERKTLFDLRRCAVVHNLPVLAHSQHVHPAA